MLVNSYESYERLSRSNKLLLGKLLKSHVSLCKVYPSTNEDLSIDIFHIIR